MEHDNRTPLNQNIDTQSIPHSGGSHLPEDLREVPQREFDKTTLSEAVDNELITTEFPHDEEVTVPSLLDSTEANPSTTAPEKDDGNTKHNRLIAIGAAGAAAVVLVGGAIFGIKAAGDASAHNEPPKKDPKATSEPVASSTPEATSTPDTSANQTPDRVPKLGTLPESMQQYKAMSLDDFNSQPEDVRLQYWAAMFGGMDNIRDFANDAYRVSQDKRDILPATISKDNTPAEIMTVTALGERLSFALSGDDRQKAAMAILEHSRGSNRWDILDAALKADPEGMTGGDVAYENLVTNADVISATEPATLPGTDQIYRDITFNGTNGQPTTTRVFYHDVSYNGQTFGWWTEN